MIQDWTIIDIMLKVSLTLAAIDKMPRVIHNSVTKSNYEFDKLEEKIQKTFKALDKLGLNMTKLGAGLTAAGAGARYESYPSAQLGAALQIAMKEAGTAPEAAETLKAFFNP